jgi:hypothetical protein
LPNLETIDLRGPTPTGSKSPTLAELLATPTGQKMLKEHEKARATVQEVVDKRHEEETADLRIKSNAANSAFEALRAEVLPLVEVLAEHATRLRELRARYRGLVSALRKHGVDVTNCPMDLYGEARKKVVNEIRTIKEVLPRSI